MSTTTHEETIERLRKQAEEETEEQAEPKDKEKKSEARTYLVFEEINDETYRLMGPTEAHTVEEALSAFGEHTKKDKRYVAVTERYFQPKKLQVETTTKITFV